MLATQQSWETWLLLSSTSFMHSGFIIYHASKTTARSFVCVTLTSVVPFIITSGAQSIKLFVKRMERTLPGVSPRVILCKVFHFPMRWISPINLVSRQWMSCLLFMPSEDLQAKQGYCCVNFTIVMRGLNKASMKIRTGHSALLFPHDMFISLSEM